MADTPVVMTCMTTKKKFEVLHPPVRVLKNNRYAYRVACPWEGKNGKKLVAFKFCSYAAYQAHCDRNPSAAECEHPEEAECEHLDDVDVDDEVEVEEP